MPVRVHTPVRIRVDEAALFSRCGCIEDALAKAAGRALANSRDVVLAARGGYVGLCLYTPEFVWTGDGLPRIPVARREELEQRWTATLLGAASGAGLTNFVRDADRAADPLPAEIAERFDPARWDAGAALYQVPSYDNQGGAQPVKEEEPGIVIQARKGVKLGWTWKAITSEDEFDELFTMGLASRNLDVPATGHMGALYLNGNDNDFWITVYEYPGPKTILDQPPKITRLAAEGDGIGEVPADFPPDADYKFRLVGDATTTEAKTEIYRKFYGQTIKNLLKSPTQENIDQQLNAMVAKTADYTRFVALVINDQDASLLGTDNGFPTEEFPVIPLAHWGEISGKPGAGKGGRGGQKGTGDKGKGKLGGGGKSGQGEGKTAFVIGDKEGGDTLFPVFLKDGEKLECNVGFDGEPSLKDLGADGDRLRPLIEKLARHLAIDPCEYAGAFCLMAAKVIAGRADDVATYSVLQEVGELKPARSGEGNLGKVNFKPVPSVAIQLLQHLAAAAPLVHDLSMLTQSIYDKPENAAKIQGFRNGNAVGWDLDFISELLDAMGRSVGYLFAMTCRVLLLQLLRASRQGILERQNNPGYADRFEQLIKAQVSPLQELKALLDVLKPFAPTSIADEAGTLIFGTWREARHEMISMFELRDPKAGDLRPGLGAALERKNGRFHIRDSKGYLWSREELEAAIALRTAVAEAIDPLVIQIDADPELARRFAANPNNIKGELAKLLKEMETNNSDKIKETEESAYFAFKASKIYEADTRFSGTARSGYNLSGIHQQAHEAIGDHFGGSDFYRLGLKYLFDSEMGKREIGQFFEFTGVILLSVICAPLGTAVGVALAIYHEHEALEEQRLFKSLLNPEIVITRAEVEIDLFIGELGVALAFIPEVGTILRGATTAGRTLIKGELIAVTKAFAAQAAKGIAKEVIKNLEKGLLETFIKEFVKAEIINELVGKLIVGPVVDQIQADFERSLMAKEALEH